MHQDQGQHILNTPSHHSVSLELQRSQARARALAQASVALLKAEEPHLVLAPVIEKAAVDLGIDQAYSFDLLPDGQHLQLVFSFGVGREAQAQLQCAPLSGPLCGIVAETRAPLILTHLQSSTDPRLAPGRNAGLQSYAGFPVFVQGRLVNVMSFCSSTELAFDSDTIIFFETLIRYIQVVRERREREKVLSEGEARYRTLFESIDEGFCIIEFFDGPHGPLSDYIHVEANAAYTANTGIPNVVGQKLREMVPDEADAWVARYGEVLRTGKPIRFEQELVATGRHLELASFRIEPPSKKQVAVLFKDVTARKKAERDLQIMNETLETRVTEALAERRLFADVVEGLNGYVQIIDQNYSWLALNTKAAQAFTHVYGTRPKVGDCLDDILKNRPDDLKRIRALWARALRGEAFVDTGYFIDTDGEKLFYEMRLNALHDANGRQTAAYMFAYDVTDRVREQERLQQTEDALRQAQKMEAVGQLTGGLAHDFNNLLAGISGAFQMIGVRLAQGRNADVEKYLSAGQSATRRASALTHRLLAFSRRQTLQPKPIVINSLLADFVELVQRTVGPAIQVETVAASGLWPAMVDPNQLENALLNLCINARDAMPKGGKITIETGNKWLDLRAAQDHGLEAGQYVTVSVSDTGVGIPKDVLPRVFDPFFTTKPIGQGTGLGLSMVYGFARQSHGHVRIYSEVGNGTMVCIYLPRHVSKDVSPDHESMAQHVATQSAGETVVIIDDEPTVRMLIADTLGDLGYACTEAADGAAGLKVLETLPRVDLLITDVGLPGGLNGRQVADAARTLLPDLKVLFITGYAENAVLNHGHIERGMEVLTKPFSMDDLVVRVERMFKD
jgi:signal transduction histidine kinase/ActR/RegA family two-component response regulator